MTQRRSSARWLVGLVASLAVVLGVPISAQARTTTVQAAAHAYDISTTSRVDVLAISTGHSRAAVSGDVRERFVWLSIDPRGSSTTTSVSQSVATEAVRPTSVIDDVMAETRAGAGNLTSKYTLTADEALTAGERWVGPGYTELGKQGSGVFRSADGTRQFRIDNGSITGAHSPGVPHVHLETILPGSKVPVANNHIPFAG